MLTMQYAVEPAVAGGYLSDGGETTAESINLAQLEGHQWSQLEDGTIEVTNRLPKKDYYLSLRRFNGVSPTATTTQQQQHQPLGSISSGSMLGPVNGSAGLTGTIPPARNSGTNSRSATAGTLRGRTNTSVLDFKPSGKTVDCPVVMLDGTTKEFRLDRAAYGQQLFDAVCDYLGLIEVEFFGITYYDSTNNWFWLNLHQKISKQLGKNDWQFEFQVRFYSYDIDGIKEDLTRYYLCLQVRQDVVSGQLPCSFMTYCLLGAYIVQSEAGDHDPLVHQGIKYIQGHPFAPHMLQTPEMLERIVHLHKLHRGKTPEEADRLFLHNARCLALYGVDLNKVRTSQDKDVNLGVYYAGILLYRNRVRLMRISWPRIISLSHKGRNFIIQLRPTDTKPSERNMSFKCANSTFAKRLYNICVEHHAFFRLRNSTRPKKPSYLPSFASRKYHYPSTILHSPVHRGGPGNGASRPLSQFRPILNHPNDSGWFTLAPREEAGELINGHIASQYQYQPAVFGDDVNTTNPVYLDNKYLTNGPPHTGSQGAQRFLPPGSMVPPASNNSAPIHRPTFDAEHWRISPADCSSGLGINERGLDVAAQRGSGWQGCRANKGIKAPGAFYYEVACLEDGLVRVGWSTNEANLELGADNCGFGFGSDAIGAAGAAGAGRSMHRNTGHDYGVMVRQGDVIGCLIDLDKGSVSWSSNGKEFQRAFTIPDQLRGEAFLPAASLKDSRLLFNFGEDELEHFPGGPYQPVAQASDDSEVPNRITGWRLNPYDATSRLDVAPDGSMTQAYFNQGWQGCRANQGIRGVGRFYFEVSPMEAIGLCRVGWSTEEANLNLGSDRFGFGYGADNEAFGLNGQQGKRMYCDEIENYGEAFTKDDVIGCYLDTVERTIRWSKNGVDFGDAYHIPSELSNTTFFPAVSLTNSTVEVNFGDKPFKYYPGPDWTPVCCAPTEYIKRTRRKGPERKVKGWSYIDPSILEPALRQQLKVGSAVASPRTKQIVQRQEDNLTHEISHLTTSPLSPPPHLPPGAIPMPGMTGNSSISPINHPSATTTTRQSTLASTLSPSSGGSRSPTKPVSSTPSAISPTSVNQSGGVGDVAPVYNLRGSNSYRVLNGGMVVNESVEHGEPHVETQSYVDEHGKLIKRTVKQSSVTTTKTIAEQRIIARNMDTLSGQTNGHAGGDQFDLDLDAALMEVTQLDTNASVLRDTVGKVEIRTTQPTEPKPPPPS